MKQQKNKTFLILSQETEKSNHEDFSEKKKVGADEKTF